VRIARPAVALATLACLAGGVSAHAAVKPVCNLVVDDAGDAGVITGQDGMDVLSADVSSDSKNLTAVIRLKSAPASKNPQAPSGTNYYFNYTGVGSDNVQYLTATVPFSGAPTFATGQVAPTGGQDISTDDPSNGTVGSIKGSVITISTPLSNLRVKGKPGAKLTGLGVEVRVLIGVNGTGLLQLADAAEGSKAYTTGTPSCVKPGKI
jgi:hypothetical protein